MTPGISLIIPLYNEAGTIEQLITTINDQALQPSEIVLVDGGSSDNTVEQIQRLIQANKKFRLIEAGRAMPGKGRNIGVRHSTCDWIAFTDAGMKLDSNWLKELASQVERQPGTDIVYGNYAPQQRSFFERCLAFAFVPPAKKDHIRAKAIPSTLMKKAVFEKIGGFPEWRAAEDLAFIEKASEPHFKVAYAPDAFVHWQLQSNLRDTYKKFSLYSYHNVIAGRQAGWHYGVLRQYLLLLGIATASIVFSNAWILLFIPTWLFFRVQKRVLMHRYENGLAPAFNPAILLLVGLLLLTIDMATFSGWIRALKQGGKRKAQEGNAGS